MPALSRLRAERGQMSAMERRIADYILKNAHLLRDYSSQQLADTLKISQSSVVKFAQRLGYKGYPDMKLSITEALARAAAKHEEAGPEPRADDEPTRGDTLWRGKCLAERDLRMLNPPETIARAARLIADADTLFVASSGLDAHAGNAFAVRMAMLGLRCVAPGDTAALLAAAATACRGDALLAICEHGSGAGLLNVIQVIRGAGAHVVVITRGQNKSIAGVADAALVVTAHDPQPHVEDVVHEAMVRHLLDELFLRVLADRRKAGETFIATRARALETLGD